MSDKIRIDKINIGKRFRQDMGDLKELADGIRNIGYLLQPIVVQLGKNGTYDLVAGARRLYACRDELQWSTIPAIVVELGDDKVLAEMDENELRKPFSMTEKTAIYQAYLALETEKAQARRARKTSDRGSEPHSNGRAKEIAAERVGHSRKTLDAASTVVANGVPELQEAMDHGKVSVADAAAVAELPEKTQKKAVKAVKDKKARTLKQAVLQDAKGKEIPSKLRDEFGDGWLLSATDTLAIAATKIREAKLATGAKKRERHFPFFQSKRFIEILNDVDTALDELIEITKSGRPMYICTECEGARCHHCLQSGLLPKWKYEELSK